MSKRIRLLAALAALLLSLSSAAVAQEAVPHPTRLRVAMRNGRVELSWVDDPASEGGNAVYRHLERIGTENFAAASKIGTVGRSLQFFVDVPPDQSQYYYAVLALSAEGVPYVTFAAPGNASSAPISLNPIQPEPAPEPAVAASPAAPAAARPDLPAPASASAVPAPLAVSPAAARPAAPVAAPAAAPTAAPPASPQPAEPAATAAPAPPAAAVAGPITAISAQARGDSIALTYKGGAGQRLVAYRGTTPIRLSSDLLDATLVATYADKDGSFIDYPVPGIDYWYALLIEDDLKAGRIELVKGRNATSGAVRVALTKRNEALAESSPSSRTLPLPAFLLDAATGVAVPAAPSGPAARGALSPDSEKALAGILAIAPPVKRPLPALKLLTEELSPPSGGEDYALSLIVTQKLIRGDWASSADQLRKYLSLNRSEKAAARARFYLGQALAYSGSYRDAFFEFLSARALFPRESAPWIEYVLAAQRSK